MLFIQKALNKARVVMCLNLKKERKNYGKVYIVFFRVGATLVVRGPWPPKLFGFLYFIYTEKNIMYKTKNLALSKSIKERYKKLLNFAI